MVLECIRESGGEIDKYGLELIPKIEVDEAEILKAEKMYEEEESN